MQRMQRNQLRKLRALMKPAIRIGTRGSQLALWQARWVKKALLGLDDDITVTLEIIKTKGDKIIDVPLAKIGGKGLFVKEIEEALLDKRIDLAVHSMKDMPAELPDGLTIGAIPQRANPFDALVSRHHDRLETLPEGARVGTSSLRRAAQLLNRRPDLCIVPLRGNLDTRMKKLKSEAMDAIVLACAGLERLGMAHHITAALPENIMLPAVGQGALCIESRAGDKTIARHLAALEHIETRRAVMAERAFLKRLDGGCQVPIAAHAKIGNHHLELTGLVAELDGSAIIQSNMTGKPEEAESLGTLMAEELLRRGADDILTRLQQHAQ